MLITYNSNVARRFGANAATVFEYISGEITNSVLGEQNDRWYRVSASVLSASLPCFSVGQIRHALKKLVNGGLLKKREVNNSRFDRTLSYALTEFGTAVTEACQYNGRDKEAR